MQNTLLALAIALIAAIVAAVIGPWLIDWNGHRPRIEAEASRLFGAPVRIGGTLDIRLLPTISIDARDVTVGEGQGSARIGRLRGDLRIAPLLRGQVALNSLHVRDADVTLRSGALPARLVAVDSIIVENARLSVSDGETPPRLLAERLRLSGDSRGASGPLRLEGTAVSGEQVHGLGLLASFTEAGPLALRLRVPLGPTAFGFEAEGLIPAEGRLRFDGELVVTGMAGRLPWRVAGPVGMTPQALTMQRVEAQLGAAERLVRGTGSFRFTFSGEGAQAVVTVLQADVDRLLDGPVRLPREAMAALLAEMPAIAAPSVPISLGLDVSGLTLGGAAISDLRGDFRADGGVWHLDRLSAILPGEAALDLSGQVRLGPAHAFAGSLNLRAARPAALMAWFDGLQAPTGTLDDPLRVDTRITADPGRLVLESIDAETVAGRTTGRIALDIPALGRHALEVDLASDALDLDLLTRVARGAGARLDPATDARLRLRAKRASLAGFLARDLDLAVATDGRTFEAERLSIGDFAGFGMDLTGRLDGLGGPLLGRLSGRVRAETMDGLVALLARHEATRDLAALVRDRAPSLAGADLGLTFAASGRAALGLRIEGRMGETTVQVDAAGSGDPLVPASLTGRVKLDLQAPRADRLLALVAGATPGETPGGAARLSAEWIRADGATHRLSAGITTDETTLTLSGQQGPGGSGQLAVSLRSGDIGPLMPLLGVPAELAGRLPARFELSATATGNAWRTERAEGDIGGTRVAARLTAAGRKLAGELALGTLAGEAVMAALSGPAWLVDVGAGEFAPAAFGTLATDRLDADIAVTADRVALGTYPSLTGLKAHLRREGGRTVLSDLSARLGDARISGQITLDRSAVRTLANARLAVDGVPAGLVWPGADGTAVFASDLTAEGATPAAFVAALRGSGTIGFTLSGIAGADPGALARVTRQAELAQDIGRPMTDMAFGIALAKALDTAVPLAAATPGAPSSAPLTWTGLAARAGSIALDLPGGRVTWSGTADLREGTLAALLTVAPDPIRDAETMPVLAIRHSGPLGGPERTIETDDVSGWLGLRLVDRAALRIRMTESDRVERSRQRAFSRFTALPPPQVEVPLPPMPDPPTAAQFLPAPVAVPEPRPEAAGSGTPREPGDWATRVRRTLDGRPEPVPDPRGPPVPAPPLSILPPVAPLPPPIEVGPAPGMRR